MQMPLPTLVQTPQVAGTGSLRCSGEVVLGPAIPTSCCLSTSSFHSLEPSQLLLCPGQVWQVWLLWIPRLPLLWNLFPSGRPTHPPVEPRWTSFWMYVTASLAAWVRS